ncbi:MAG: hypothetical protein IKK24_03715, partial [Clostridia bacterium]|nr:hypothetical protein [Clostridia bacterium]
VIRQYWHWWVALVNVSNIEFNEFPIYMAPDRQSWLGTWSNDGPESIAALSLTNQRGLARKLILSYCGAAISDEGVHSWYLNSDGVGCNGNPGDVGRLSHGVPNIIHTVEYYVRNTGDKEILSANCNGMTLYERISKYFKETLKIRDLDNDGLIEWRNLWETGWDDKLGCFFKTSTLEDWCEIVINGTDEEISEFYKKNSYPVVAIVEQVYMRWACASIKNLAEIMGDGETVILAENADKKIEESVNKKCWNEDDGFYHDFSVRDNCQIETKSADCYYYMYFEKDMDRVERVCKYLKDEKYFGSVCIPMQAICSKGFSATGYWSGGHWPREMSYLSMGLNRAGKSELAQEICLKAINSGTGNHFYEVMNPITGKRSTAVTKMAYVIMDIIALLDIKGKIKWTE